MGIRIRKVTVRLFFQTIVENIDPNRHELKVISLNEEDFDPVLRYGYRKADGGRSFYSSFPRIDPVGGSPDFLFIPSGGVVCRSLMKGWIDRVFTPGIAYSANDQGSFIWNYLRGKQFKKLLKGKTASIYAILHGAYLVVQDLFRSSQHSR